MRTPVEAHVGQSPTLHGNAAAPHGPSSHAAGRAMGVVPVTGRAGLRPAGTDATAVRRFGEQAFAILVTRRPRADAPSVE